jgi:hypothetical protein
MKTKPQHIKTSKSGVYRKNLSCKCLHFKAAEEIFPINNSSFFLKKLDKEKQIKTNVNRRKETIECK